MLGRENISSPVTAVMELVKNAYDADASKIRLLFERASEGNGSVVIADDGEGMDRDDLIEKWLLISTDNKARNPISPSGRVKVGEKGIGRLAMNRIADRAVVITHKRPQVGTKLELDWTRYNEDRGDLHAIKHPISPVAIESEARSGTTIQMTELRDRWNERLYEALYDDLALFVPPFDPNMIDFRIEFECDERPDLSGPVSSPMLAVAEYALESVLDEYGRIHQKLTHRSGAVAKDIRMWDEAFADVPPGQLPACGPVRFLVYFYLEPGPSLRSVGVSTADMRAFLRRYGGVRIYRDGVRVKPYGDPGPASDWLGLNARRVSSPGGVSSKSGYRVAAGQIVAGLFISRITNPEVVDQTNREGLVENKAYHDLFRFALFGIQYLERERSRQERARREAEGQTGTAEDVEEKLETIVDELVSVAAGLDTAIGPADSGSTASVGLAENVRAASATMRGLASDLEAARSAVEEHQNERQALLGLATLGIAMVTFGHETTRAVNNLLNRVRFLQDAIVHLPDPHKETAVHDLKILNSAAEQIESWGQFALSHVRRDKRERRNVTWNEVIPDVLKRFKSVTDARKVAIELDLSTALPPIKAFRMDFDAILVNLVTNALDAMFHTPLPSRRLRIGTSVDEGAGVLRVVFADSGKGIRDEDVINIFDPLFTTRIDERGNLAGTGMGLAILQDLVKSYGGTISVTSRGQLGGAEFTLEFPNRVRGVANEG
jgi:signal transduction histidine kinase